MGCFLDLTACPAVCCRQPAGVAAGYEVGLPLGVGRWHRAAARPSGQDGAELCGAHGGPARRQVSQV